MEQGHNYIDTAIEYVKMKLSELDMRILQFSTEERKAYQRKLREILNRIKVIKLRGEDAIFDTCYTMEVIFYMKKRFFQHENEFRIVITIPDNKFKEIERKDIYGYRNANGILTPYLKLNFDKNALLGITASPTNNGELVDKSIDEYCEYCGIDKNSLTEGITHSEIPVRF